jgi:hypothetical protein
MNTWIIIKTQKKIDLANNFYITTDLSELAVCNGYGILVLFDTLDQAANYREENSIDGQCYELPVY